MTATPPSLQRVLVFIGERLVKATRDAQMRPTKNTTRRLRSLEMLAASCVADAARGALVDRRDAVAAPVPAPAPVPVPAPAPAPAPVPAAVLPAEPATEDLGPLLPQDPPERPVESGAEVRGVWAVPPE